MILSLSASGGNSTKCLYVKAVAQPTGAGTVYIHGKLKQNVDNPEGAAERACIWERTGGKGVENVANGWAEEVYIKSVRGENGNMPNVDCTGSIGKYEFILNNRPADGYEFVCYANVLKTDANPIYLPSECYALIHGDGGQHFDFNYLTPESAYDDTYGVNGDNHWINGNVSDDEKPKNSPVNDSPENVFAGITTENAGNYFSADPDRTVNAIFRPIGARYPRFNHGAYFVNMVGWANVKGYAWNGDGESATTISGTWPGNVVIDATDVTPYIPYDFSSTPYEVKTYEVRFDERPEKIIFNNDNNGEQTDNMTFLDGGYYTYDGLTGKSKLLFLDNDVEFQIDEDTPISSGMRVCYPRKFTAGQKSTVCLPFALTAEQADAAGKFYMLSTVSSTTVNFEEMTGAIPANTPCVFEAATEYPFEDLDIQVLPKTELQTIVSSDGDGQLISTLEKVSIASDDQYTYFGYTTSGEWVKANTGTLRPYRACLKVDSQSAIAKANTLTATFDDATAIEKVSVNDNVNSAVYDLQGRKIADNPSSLISHPSSRTGVKIVNGKKYINK